MFERFTHPARRAVVWAQDEARTLGHDYIGTEHLLLGVAREEGPAATALAGLGMDLQILRDGVREIIGEGPTPGPRPPDAEALRSIGIDVEEVRRRVEAVFGPGALDLEPLAGPRWRRVWRLASGCSRTHASGYIPFTPRAKKALELSLRESLRLRHDHIGTEHILLGLIREGEGVAAELLREHAGSLDRVRIAVIEAMGGNAPGEASGS